MATVSDAIEVALRRCQARCGELRRKLKAVARAAADLTAADAEVRAAAVQQVRDAVKDGGA